MGLFDHLSALKAHSVDICKDPVVFVGTPSIQTKALLVSGNPEPLVRCSSGNYELFGLLIMLLLLFCYCCEYVCVR